MWPYPRHLFLGSAPPFTGLKYGNLIKHLLSSSFTLIRITIHPSLKKGFLMLNWSVIMNTFSEHFFNPRKAEKTGVTLDPGSGQDRPISIIFRVGVVDVFLFLNCEEQHAPLLLK